MQERYSSRNGAAARPAVPDHHRVPDRAETATRCASLWQARAECLADELINAAKGSSNSYAIKVKHTSCDSVLISALADHIAVPQKKDELERVAKSNR